MVKSSATSHNDMASTAKPVSHEPADADRAARSAFTGAAIGMSWQLAVIVLISILGGYQLDKASDSVPLWTLIGLVVALAGSIVVIRRALMRVNNFSVTSPSDSNEVTHD